MKLNTRIRTAVTVLTLLAMPLVVGSKCIFIASSGDDDDRDRPKNQQPITPTAAGTLSPATKGVAFVSGAVTGVTGDGGEFQYEQGKQVSFSIGDIALGEPVMGKSVITTADLAGSTDSAKVAAVNIKRLLLSLDANPDDDVVTIPDAVRSEAVHGNAAVSTAIQFLDFSNEAAFNNAASQLVAALTADYPHTGTLLDSATVRAIELRTPVL